MRLVRYGRAGAERPGLIDAEGTLRDLSRVTRDITPALLTPGGLARLRGLKTARLPAVKRRPRLGCPLAGIGKMVCIGLNYTDHAQEVGLPLPAEPTVFIKAPSAFAGPSDPIVRPRDAVKLDYEVELAVVIGREARYVDAARALAHVAGYCIVNDVSERAFQMEHGGTTTKGKSADSFGPVGPWLVTADEIPDPQDAPALDHGQRRAPPERPHARHGLPGAPAGGLREPLHVAPAGRPHLHRHAGGRGPRRQPPRYLQPGDVVEMGIDGLGVQRHVIAEWKRPRPRR